MVAHQQFDLSVHIAGAESHETLADELVRIADAIRFGQVESDTHDSEQVCATNDDYPDGDAPEESSPSRAKKNPWVYFAVTPSDTNAESHVKSLINANGHEERYRAARLAGLALLDEAAKMDGRKLVMVFFNGDRFAAGFANPGDGVEAMAKSLGVDEEATDLRAYEPLDMILDA